MEMADTGPDLPKIPGLGAITIRLDDVSDSKERLEVKYLKLHGDINV